MDRAFQSVDVERQVLGALIFEGDLSPVIEILKPEYFYLSRHAKIYHTMVELFMRGKPIDSHLLLDELRKKNLLDQVGGASYLADLSANVVTSANLMYHIDILKQKYLARKVRNVSQQAQTLLQSEDPLHVKDWIMSQLISIDDPTTSLGKLSDVAQKVVEEWKGSSRGEPTGFPPVDSIFMGFQPGDLVIVAGATSMGKSAFVQNVVYNLAKKGLPCLILSLEMASELWAKRFISSVSEKGIDDLADEDIQQALKVIKNLPIYIDDDPIVDLVKARAKILRIPDICFVVVDYLQLLSMPQKESREREVAESVKGLKRIARDLQVAMIVVSQLSRMVDRREDRRPRLGDLRESGVIEQTADTVMMLYRPEYYGIFKLELDEGELDTRGLVEVIVAKQRRGPTGSAWLKWEARCLKFSSEEKDIF